MGLIKNLSTVVCALLLSSTANAGEFLVLDLGDQIKAARRGDDTIALKRLINQQHPGKNLRQADLMSVLLVAKSARGRGQADLMIGHSYIDGETVGGNRGDFHTTEEDSFDRILLKNKSGDSSGKWQIKLSGRFMVHQAVVEIAAGTMTADLEFYGMKLAPRHGNDTIFLKKELKQQLGIIPMEYELVKVEVIAKSKGGNGSVSLQVGPNSSVSANLGGSPGDFHSNAQWTYDTDTLMNPSYSSQGKWQLKFRGKIKVDSVKVTLKKK